MTYTKRVAGAALTAGLLGLGLAPGTASAATTDKDCRDFASQAAAQAYFVGHGGSPRYNFNALDRNHNGIACEDYKYTPSPTTPTTQVPRKPTTTPTTQVPRKPTTTPTTQVPRKPTGAPATGGGGTTRTNEDLLVAGVLMLASGGTVLAVRRRPRRA